MKYYLDIARVDSYGKFKPYAGKTEFTSLQKAIAKVIQLIETKPVGIMFSNKIYQGNGSAKELRGTVFKYGKRYQFNDYSIDSVYSHKEVYKNGSVKKLWMH